METRLTYRDWGSPAELDLTIGPATDLISTLTIDQPIFLQQKTDPANCATAQGGANLRHLD
jgi:hypothetical protein